MIEEEYQILEDLFMGGWPDNRRGNSLMRKCEALYGLAKRAEGGCIVELGTFHGCGTIPLAYGAQAGYGVPVYTVDDYVEKKGWAGEPYCPQDMARFLDCIMAAGVRGEVTLIQKTVTDAVRSWARPISLLFWDLGMRDRLASDFLAWGQRIVPGGAFAVREGGSLVFGSGAVWMDATMNGEWSLGEQFPTGHVYTLVKSG